MAVVGAGDGPLKRIRPGREVLRLDGERVFVAEVQVDAIGRVGHVRRQRHHVEEQAQEEPCLLKARVTAHPRPRARGGRDGLGSRVLVP